MNITAPQWLAASNWLPTAKIAGRIALSALFLQSGVGKLIAPAATLDAIESAGLPFPGLSLAGAILTEILGGLALCAGYRLKWSAGILAAFSITTAIVFHTNFADQNQLIHFLKDVAIGGGLLQVATSGGGRFSLDARRESR